MTINLCYGKQPFVVPSLTDEQLAAADADTLRLLLLLCSDRTLLSVTEKELCDRLGVTKEEMGFVVGRTSLAIAAVTDVLLALALVNALGEPEKHKAVLEVLTAKAEKAKKRQAEAKAHQRNLRRGGKKK